MGCRIRLVLAIHNHQPIGNFDGVFEEAYRDSYLPFIEMLREYPEISISLHNSGSLLEWLVEHHPEYIDMVRELVERGQVEILGGPFYEPILANIPRRDRVGQMEAYSRYLEQLFGQKVRGMWVPERVWEPTFVSDIREADIEYTILDDYHFRCAGMTDEQLYGYFLTEDEGNLLSIFPGSETLRYTIPFQDPQKTIDYLGGIAERHPGAVIAFGDDGEKFGTWPGTKEHVYGKGWLRRFFEKLMEHKEWLSVCTMQEAVDYVSPIGRCYLPNSTYREMTEWVLETEQQMVYNNLTHHRDHDSDWPQLKQFVRGGFWRNFRVKYAESNELYARALEVSERLQKAFENESDVARPELLQQARTHLYKAQCNCPYWHGAFGGLYLPHLRNAVYEHIIAADNLLEEATDRSKPWVEVTAGDYNLDARKEIRLSGDRLIGYFAPSQGGILYELDIRTTKHNLLATLNRRPEAYHETVRKAGAQQHHQEEHHDGDHNYEANHAEAESDELASIHDLVHFKQPDLDKKLDYDQWARKSLVDHFLQPNLELDRFLKGEGHVGDFVGTVYQTELKRNGESAEVIMYRDGNMGPYPIRLTKNVILETAHGGQLKVRYHMQGLPAGMPVNFGVEFNFAGMAANADDRYYYDNEGRKLGQLQSIQELPAANRIGLIDEWLGLDAALEVSQEAEFWTFPIQTISQSEGGFELVHQSSVVIPRWEFLAPENGEWGVEITLVIDTSAAQARQLREAAVVG
ncbi:MAG: alpha-amylase/4-alpha-glucanotransferase domain-containing protein [Planctomycetaceae bacterium]